MSNTATEILAIATRLLQQRGYNGFSYQDIANELGIKKASIHYHFPSKDKLVYTIISGYRKAHQNQLQQIATSKITYRDKFEKFTALFQQTLGGEYLMCPSGMLAADSETLPKDVQQEVQGFFLDSESWLEGILLAGNEEGEFILNNKAEEIAKLIFAALEGALLAARTFQQQTRLNNIASVLLKNITTETSTDHEN